MKHDANSSATELSNGVTTTSCVVCGAGKEVWDGVWVPLSLTWHYGSALGLYWYNIVRDGRCFRSHPGLTFSEFVGGTNLLYFWWIDWVEVSNGINVLGLNSEFLGSWPRILGTIGFDGRLWDRALIRYCLHTRSKLFLIGRAKTGWKWLKGIISQKKKLFCLWTDLPEILVLYVKLQGEHVLFVYFLWIRPLVFEIKE